MNRLKPVLLYQNMYCTAFIFILTVCILFSNSLLNAEEPSSNTDACFECHEIEKDDYVKSVHAENDLSCDDCHSKIEFIPEEGHNDTPLTQSCDECHDDEKLKIFKTSGHFKSGKVKCLSCHNTHTERKKDDWTKEYVMEKCIKCHKKELIDSVKKSAHSNKGAGICTDCHNPHSEKDREEWTEEYINNKCKKCHKVENHYNTDAHAKDIYPKIKQHVTTLGCRVCHSEHASSFHQVKSKNDAMKDCQSCHSANSILTGIYSTKVKKENKNQSEGSVITFNNEEVIDNVGYLVGANRITILDILGLLMMAGGLGFGLFHGGLRILTISLRKKKKQKG